jgi:hypothetical protein
MRSPRIFVAPLALLAFATTANADAPKPSQLVTLTTVEGGGAPCGMDRIGVSLTQQNSDGTTSAFAIPPGMVFVVTGLDWVEIPAGNADILYLHSTTPNGAIFPMASGDTGWPGSRPRHSGRPTRPPPRPALLLGADWRPVRTGEARP